MSRPTFLNLPRNALIQGETIGGDKIQTQTNKSWNSSNGCFELSALPHRVLLDVLMKGRQVCVILDFVDNCLCSVGSAILPCVALYDPVRLIIQLLSHLC